MGNFMVTITRSFKTVLLFNIIFFVTMAQAEPNNLSSYYGFKEMEIVKLRDGILGLNITDFDEDGLKDIAIANNSESKINLLIQKEAISDEAEVIVAPEDIDVNVLRGPSRFSRKSITVTQRIYSLVSGDLNSDGKVDLAFYGEPKGLYIFLQKNGGKSEDKKLSWHRRKRIEIKDGLTTSKALACGDLNNDGALDLVLASRENVYIIFQKEGGALTEPVKYASMSQISEVKIADLDGNGINDLVLITTDQDMPIQVRFGLETGELGPQITYFMEKPYKVECYDIDEEKGAELLSIDYKGGRLNCYKYTKLDDDNSAWPIFYYPLSSGEGTEKRDLCIGDFDGDKLSDIMISDSAAAELILYKQTKGIGLSSPVRFPAFSDIKRLSAANIDGDGKDEIGVLSVKEKVIGKAEYEEGRLSFPEPIGISGEPLAMEFKDIDNNGSVDCVYISKDENEQKFLRVMYDFGSEDNSKLKSVSSGHQDASEEESGSDEGLKLEGLSSNPDGLKVLDADQDGLQDVLVFVQYEFPIFIRQIERGKFEVVDSSKSQSSLIKEASLRTTALAEVNGQEGKELLVAQNNFARSLIFSEGKIWSIVDQYNAKSKENTVSAVGGFKIDGSNDMPAILLLDGQKGRLQVLKPGKDKTYRFEKEINVGKWNSVEHLKMAFGSFAGKESKSILLFDGSKFALVTPSSRNYGLERLFSYETKIKDGIYGNLVAGDINNDGRTDITMVEYNGNHIEILALGADRKPVPAMRFKIFEEKSYQSRGGAGKSSVEPRELKIADVTGDGRDDLVTVIHDRIIIYPQD